MIKPVLNNVFLQFPSAFRDTITLSSGHKLYIWTGMGGEYATIEGTVYSIGGTAEMKYRIAGVEHNIEPGDTIAASYLVTSNHSIMGVEPEYDEYGRPVYDKDGNHIKSNGYTVYHNNFEIDGNNLWETKDELIMAVKKDGKWYGIGEWCLMEEVHEDKYKSSLLIVPERKILKKGAGRYLNGCLDLAEGTEVVFSERFRSVYEIEGNKYIILKKDRIECARLETV